MRLNITNLGNLDVKVVTNGTDDIEETIVTPGASLELESGSVLGIVEMRPLAANVESSLADFIRSGTESA